MMEETTNTTGTPSGVGVEAAHGEAPTPAELLRLWRLHQGTLPNRVQRGDGVLSPMEEMQWFQTPRAYGIFLNPGAITHVLDANPQRVAAIFSLEYDPTQGLESTFGVASQVVFNAMGVSTTATGVVQNVGTSETFTTTGFVGPTQLNSPIQFVIGNNEPLAWLKPKISGAYACDTCPPPLVGGIVLNRYSPNFTVRQSETGPLVQAGWDAQCGSNKSVCLCITEIVLKDWPQLCQPST